MQKWFKFTNPRALTQFGFGTEEQATAYCAIRSERFPGTEVSELESEPEEAATNDINLAVATGIDA